jgi:hypothetical protein
MYNNNFTFYPYYMNQASGWRQPTQKFAAVSGTVTRIEDFSPSPNDASAGCYKLLSLESKDKGPVNFVISPGTYFVDHEVIETGDEVLDFTMQMHLPFLFILLNTRQLLWQKTQNIKMLL